MQLTLKNFYSIALLLATLGWLVSINPATAQVNPITPDNTLGGENSAVNPFNTDIDVITGGATRGSNLFHSFLRFGILDGKAAYFINPGVDNIITRVTGGSPSNIFGILGVTGNANFYLINPKGIIFGQNARLDVGGSFFASTGDRLIFDNGFEFGASNPQAPPLLTVNVPIGLRFRDNPGNIVNQSRAIDINGNPIGLQVAPGASLTLLGGNVILDGGILSAPAGRIELGALSTPGVVGLNSDRSLIFPTGGTGSILLDGSAIVTTDFQQGLPGDISLNAPSQIAIANSLIDNRSANDNNNRLSTIKIAAPAGSIFIDSSAIDASNFGSGLAGKIFLNARDRISVANSNIFSFGQLGQILIGRNNLASNATYSPESVIIDSSFLRTINCPICGNPNQKMDAGDISIEANRDIYFTNGTTIDTSTYRLGNGGKIALRSQNGDILVSNGNTIFSNVEAGGIGKGGEIDIAARNFSLANGSQLQTLIRETGRNGEPAGRGDAGNITITVSNDVTFDGVNSNPSFSGIISQVRPGASGNAGNINIKAGSLSLTNGASISSTTFGIGNGNAGNVAIDVSGAVTLDGFVTVLDGNGNQIVFQSSIFSTAQNTGVGNGGDIKIEAGSLSMNNFSAIGNSVFDRGNGGKIILHVDGAIDLNNRSFIVSAIGENAEGNGGEIEIESGSLSMNNLAFISNSVFGRGNGGKIILNVDGAIALNNRSRIESNLRENAVGNGGDIEIEAGSLTLTNGAQLNTSTQGEGNGGNITVDVKGGAVTIDGLIALFDENGKPLFTPRGNQRFDRSGIFSEVGPEANGKGGNIEIAAGSFSLTDGAAISTIAFGNGNAGNVAIDVSGAFTLDGFTNVLTQNGALIPVTGGVVSAVENTGVGNGGQIEIEAGSLSMNNSLISNSVSGKGNAGNIILRIHDAISLDNLSVIGSSVQLGGNGIGGNIDIRSRSLTLRGGSAIQAGVSSPTVDPVTGQIIPGGTGRGGSININTTDFVDISGFSNDGFSSGLFASADRETIATSDRAAGNITVTTGDFRIANGGTVTTSTANSGRGGDIAITANTFTATNGGLVTTNTFSSGDAGNITLKIADRITLSGSSNINNQEFQSGLFAKTASGSTGNGGSISIDPRTMVVEDGGIISVDSDGTGIGGSIDLRAGSLTLDNGSISARANSNTGGNINLTIDDLLILRDRSSISATAGNAQNPGDGGNIDINARFVVAFPSAPDGSDITANAFTGRGGNVNITTNSIFGLNPSDNPTAFNDITASSELGIAGNVTINTPNVDPTKGLVPLPDNPIDPSGQIAQAPCQRRGGSEFIVTGRGGLPANPTQNVSTDNARVDLVEPVPSEVSGEMRDAPAEVEVNNPPAVVPARGWVLNDRGQVILTAYDPTGNGSERAGQTSNACPTTR
jgi:filamentous hemagglutinin family protein